MTLERKIASIFRLTDENWMRHANPLSVWSRYSVLPLLMLAIWSRTWIGWWFLVPVALSITWTLINPALFPKPESTDAWASKAVLGERLYLDRDRVEIPDHHRSPLFAILKTVALVGFLIALGSALVYSIPGAASGLALTYLAKSWFLDRMVWLYEDMRRKRRLHP
ncbi:hypothetical protein ThidrDRAFT_0778 [Thiorhodococcus drewsii AZ1]|uniref:Transmembrane protein n=1 Tax=Thiorhodococcus drewsii AZ1 TaxID=765913 RepID=G2DXQ1_9GAMM|nr:DUF6653 family protein [Thiorhodococcus drewsii]EGV33100.1 hypothetical protein ThidrDRAFT_0778 [Thiorhodococcus drewsii AZ1]